jgi:hypothetical protein
MNTLACATIVASMLEESTASVWERKRSYCAPYCATQVALATPWVVTTVTVGGMGIAVIDGERTSEVVSFALLTLSLNV